MLCSVFDTSVLIVKSWHFVVLYVADDAEVSKIIKNLFLTLFGETGFTRSRGENRKSSRQPEGHMEEKNKTERMTVRLVICKHILGLERAETRILTTRLKKGRVRRIIVFKMSVFATTVHFMFQNV